ERVGPLDRDLDLRRAVGGALDADLDAAELGGLELDCEGLWASLLGRRGKRDLDRLSEGGGDLGRRGRRRRSRVLYGRRLVRAGRARRNRHEDGGRQGRLRSGR